MLVSNCLAIHSSILMSAPHLGHLYSMLLCDIRNRWEILNHRPSYFTTGTDEHGLKVQAAAEKAGIEPKLFVDILAPTFQNLALLMNIKYDRFIRTTDADHAIAVKNFWNTLESKGYIYEGEHSGWYSVSDETFYPETQIEEVIDSKTNLKKVISKETGSEVTYQKEKNYFFKLSQFYDKLLDHLRNQSDFIIPRAKQEQLMKELINNGKLDDLSISRPSSRLQWGISVPGDASQTIYVWLDALVNYITSAGYPWPTDDTQPWPATHVVGKDIVRFHGIYWPCFLMAAEISLPNQLAVHGHWLCQGTKMSKSIGNVVDPIAMADYYGTDPLRFYLCENSVLEGDSDFSEDRLMVSRNSLMSKFGNLIMRSCGVKFNVERAASSLDEVKFKPELQQKYTELVNSINSLRSDISGSIERFETIPYVQKIWDIIAAANVFFQNAEPWTLDSSIESQRILQDAVIHASTEATRVSSILLIPIIPELSKTFLDRLGVHPDKRTIEYTYFGADTTYGSGVNRSGDAPMAKLAKRNSK